MVLLLTEAHHKWKFSPLDDFASSDGVLVTCPISSDQINTCEGLSHMRCVRWQREQNYTTFFAKLNYGIANVASVIVKYKKDWLLRRTVNMFQ